MKTLEQAKAEAKDELQRRLVEVMPLTYDEAGFQLINEIANEVLSRHMVGVIVRRGGNRIDHGARAKRLRQFAVELIQGNQYKAALRCLIEARREYECLNDASQSFTIHRQIDRVVMLLDREKTDGRSIFENVFWDGGSAEV
jgi:hypothetical protein